MTIDPTEIIVMPRLRLSQIHVQVDQHFAVHHADFIDDQIMMIGPVLPLIIAYLFLFLFPNQKIGSAMKGSACDIESSRTSGGSNHQLILSIEHSKPCTDGSYQMTFSSAAFSKHSHSQLWTDLASSKSMIRNDTKDMLLCFIQRKFMNYIHNHWLIVRTIGEEDVRGVFSDVMHRSSLSMGLSCRRSVAEPLRLGFKIGERKTKGIDIVWNRLR